MGNICQSWCLLDNFSTGVKLIAPGIVVCCDWWLKESQQAPAGACSSNFLIQMPAAVYLVLMYICAQIQTSELGRDWILGLPGKLLVSFSIISWSVSKFILPIEFGRSVNFKSKFFYCYYFLCRHFSVADPAFASTTAIIEAHWTWLIYTYSRLFAVVLTQTDINFPSVSISAAMFKLQKPKKDFC